MAVATIASLVKMRLTPAPVDEATDAEKQHDAREDSM
jgi:hypothetical protein